MKVLELFCGTKSVSNVFREAGHEVFTVDIDPQFNPDLCIDIMGLTPDKIPFKPDVIWASPPCQSFSIASCSHHWNMDGTPKSEAAVLGLAMVEKTINLINQLQPKWWFIENPRGMLRKKYHVMDLPRFTVTYCQYGDSRMKPTDIWTNATHWQPKPMCKNGMPCHVSAPRGSKTGTQGLKNAKERGKIPKELAKEIMRVCENGY